MHLPACDRNLNCIHTGLWLILHNLLRNQAEQPDENCEEENDFNELNEHCG